MLKSSQRKEKPEEEEKETKKDEFVAKYKLR